MLKSIFAVIVASTFLAGCASVPMASKEQDTALKSFNTPAKDKSGVYIYRNSSYGSALKKKLTIDETVIGESAMNVYFYHVVEPGKHKISTESEFGDNHIDLTTEGGKNYFVEQYIKMGVFVGGSNLKTATEAEGKKGVLACSLAASNNAIIPSVASTTNGNVLASSSSSHSQPNSPAKKYSAEELNARYTYQAEKLTHSMGCTSTALASTGPGFEVYSATCADKSVSIRCDFGRCAAQ
jgi:hypothetical protein